MNASYNVPPLHVLLVDDDVSVRAILRTHLELDGHLVMTAVNGVHAWECMQQRSFDLVITDWAMPQMDGRELVAAVKARWPSQRIVMISGCIDPGKMDGDEMPGVDVMLEKPIRLAQLRAAVAEAMGYVSVG